MNAVANQYVYPCNRGMGGLNAGYHRFEVSPHGVCCVYCGAVPRDRALAAEAELRRIKGEQ